jgi:hypothetical protein
MCLSVFVPARTLISLGFPDQRSKVIWIHPIQLGLCAEGSGLPEGALPLWELTDGKFLSLREL